MDRGAEGEGRAEDGPRRLSAISEGLIAGWAAPLAGLAPWWVSGDLAAAVADRGAYPHLPAFAMTALPGLIAGGVLALRWISAQDLFRASVGALIAGTLVGSAVLWFSYDDTETWRRLLVAFSGGPALVGFWVWVGVGLGAILGRTWCRPVPRCRWDDGDENRKR